MVLSKQPTKSRDAVLGYQLSLDLGFGFQPKCGDRVLVLETGKTGRIAVPRQMKLSTGIIDFGEYIINLRGKVIGLKRHEFRLI